VGIIGAGIGGLGAALSSPSRSAFTKRCENRVRLALSNVRGQQGAISPSRRPDQRARDTFMASGSTDFSIKAVEWIYAHDATNLGSEN
jgi:hypothetical protein